MPEKAPTLGQVVTTSAGRDQGHTYVVIGYAAPHLVLLADGRTRTVTNPKKKNIRHIKVSKMLAREIADKLTRGDKVTDEELRHTLAQLTLPDKL